MVGLDQHVHDAGPDRVGQALRRHHHGAVLRAQQPQPGVDLLAEGGLAQHGPGLVQHEQRRRAIERLLEATEQVEQHGDGRLLLEREQVLHLEHHEAAVADAVTFGVEQPAQRV